MTNSPNPNFLSINPVKALAITCLVAGLSRAVTSFIPWDTDRLDFEVLATCIDLGTLLGLCAFYFTTHRKLGTLGLTGFVIAVAGLSFITGPDQIKFGVNTYELGIAVIAFGLIAMSASMIKQNIARNSATLWLMIIPAQLLLSLVSNEAIAYAAAGVLYGLGFAALGIHTLRQDCITPR